MTRDQQRLLKEIDKQFALQGKFCGRWLVCRQLQPHINEQIRRAMVSRKDARMRHMDDFERSYNNDLIALRAEARDLKKRTAEFDTAGNKASRARCVAICQHIEKYGPVEGLLKEIP